MHSRPHERPATPSVNPLTFRAAQAPGLDTYGGRMESELSSCLDVDEDNVLVAMRCYACECGGIQMAILEDTQVLCIECGGIQTGLTAIYSTPKLNS